MYFVCVMCTIHRKFHQKLSTHHATIYLQISTHRISRTSKDSLRIRCLILLTLWRHDVSRRRKNIREALRTVVQSVLRKTSLMENIACYCARVASRRWHRNAPLYWLLTGVGDLHSMQFLFLFLVTFRAKVLSLYLLQSISMRWQNIYA